MGLRGGIDLGGTKVEAIVVNDDDYAVRGQSRCATPSEGGPAAIVKTMVSALTEAAKAAGTTPSELAGVGVGAPGVVDMDAGTLARAGNLSGWDAPYPLVAALGEQFGCSVALGNDVEVAVQAELELGVGRGVDSFIGVFWGTGIGGGVVLGGKMWHGRGAAGEIGHIVVKRGGARCTCGRLGCMEAYAGRRAMELRARRLHERGRSTDLFKIMRERDREALSSGVWARALEHGDELAIELIDRAVRALGAGVASVVNVLDVELVVLGGGLGLRFGAPMLARLTEAMQPHLYNDDRPPQMALAALGDLGGATGAALLSAHSSPARAP
ncbi:MAG TPA: ROK family protein [Solirubrobacteraceae bacterium]|jgi:glucokinase|nr:ROK family protein [Solirubrobacteraceae bacterium]